MNAVRLEGEMAKKGLTKEIIVNAALEQIEKNGLSAFYLRNLAASLGVQVSSLYNHIEGQSDLLAEVGICAVNMLTGMEEAAIADKLRDEALFSLANAYRRFAGEHTELYRIIMGVHTLDIPLLESEAEKIVKPILRVISDYGIEGKRQIHYQRLLRSVMHGFFAHENSGGFSVSDIDKDASYRFSIECIAIRMRSEEEVIHENR